MTEVYLVLAIAGATLLMGAIIVVSVVTAIIFIMGVAETIVPETWRGEGR